MIRFESDPIQIDRILFHTTCPIASRWQVLFESLEMFLERGGSISHAQLKPFNCYVGQ